jgi:tripeptide aminopeptidase
MFDPEKLTERFLRYVRIDTRSDSAVLDCPSTKGQWDFGTVLMEDLRRAGCVDVLRDENGYVTATLPATIGKKVPVIGLIAHMDTSPDFTGRNVNPRIIRNYAGDDIHLDSTGNHVLSTEEFPELLHYTGQDLIVTDGHTLLGADDKAGITEIIEAIAYLAGHPEIPHGKVRLGFTPDEEIGRGADRFDVAGFGADFAFTVDGGPIGELEFENFNAAGVQIRIQGRNVHPGTAKNKMINALQLAMEFHAHLPEQERPETTEGYEGFYHLTRLDGTVESAQLDYIIRDHDRSLFENKKQLIQQVAAAMNMKYKPARLEVSIRDQYFNMREKIEPVKHIIDLAARAIRMAGLEPVVIPIRGGTDGAKLSYMGLPTPNLFTGGHNYHGRYEFIPIPSMVKAAEVIIHLLKLSAES